MDNRGGRLQRIKGILYRLKRTWGQPASVHYLTSHGTDFETGARSVAVSAVRVKRAILLPTTVHREFKYDIGYLRANSNFTYGGLWTAGTRQMIVDRADLPRDFTIRPSDEQYVVYDHKRYAIKQVEDIESYAYMVTMEYTANVATSEVHEVFAHDELVFTESFSGGPL